MTTSHLTEIIPDYTLAETCSGASREQILAAEAYIKADPDHKGMADYPLEHFHAANVYGRKIIIPANTIMTGMIHKHACINVILQGEVSVATHDSVTVYTAPCTFISTPGSKRVLHTHSETHWMTFHGSGETDLLKLQDEFVCETYEQYDRFINTQQRLTVQNGQIELFGEHI